MTTSFSRAIAEFTRRERKRIEKALLEWSRSPDGVTVAPNVRDREHFLPKRYMARLLRALLESDQESIPNLQSNYQSECYSMQRKGGSARIQRSTPPYLGMAVDYDQFQDYLVDASSRRIPSRLHAREFIRRLEIDPTDLNSLQKSIMIREYTTWVTWNLESPTQDPFHFVCFGQSDEVRAALALEERYSGPIILFRYSLPASVEVYRPTVADAGLFRYFSPPLLTEKGHGFTRPWELARIEVGERKILLDPAPMPEAVHRPLNFGSLEVSVEVLR